ncbi:uncharacterized protein LOC117785969 [Drosophila innubila]|uniref:uncharacterized protein LOC117785969 n=1 Tax=Drosophila innubila TaxID=198719 RepID=UPI00148E298B|nr:uncharacterized protein LOC117785969 [Drosophila innubila]
MHLVAIAIILGCQCLRLHCIHLSELPHQPELHLQQQLLLLLERIRLERQFDTVLVYGRAPCVFHTVLQQLEVPTVLLTSGSSHNDWDFNSEPLLLSCGATAEQEKNSRTLLKLQHARRLIYLEADVQPQWLCEDYFQREQHNVAMLDDQFATSGNFYSCRCFQQENHVQLMLQDSNSIYVRQFGNMKGAIIRSEADQLSPRAMIYRDAKSGKIRMIGYVANLVNTFVQRVNATLHLREDYVIGKTTYFEDIVNWTRKNQLDVAATLSTSIFEKNFDILSYPYVLSSYCAMIPVPDSVPYREIYAVIVHPLALGLLVLFFLIFSLLLIYSEKLSWRDLSLANVLLNDRCLRGLLGQSFPLPENPNRYLKAIILLICFASIMTTTMYQSYLQAYFTQPPLEPILRSLQEVRESPYRVATHPHEANELLNRRILTTDNDTNLHVLETWQKYVQLRDNFNASYVYLVTDARWRTYAEQQRFFKHPVFFYSDDICVYRYAFLCVPLRRHLPYRELFEEHMQLMQEFGMLQFWMSRSYFDMVQLRQTALKDYSNPKPVEEDLYLRDLTWILCFYLAGHLIACFCFAIELYMGRNRSVFLPPRMK